MEAKTIWNNVFSLFLCFMLAMPLAGCGGGGSSSSTSSTPTSVSGVVADGYLMGATVFSDRDGNKKWDEGEPKAVTEEGGLYTLEGEELDQHPIVVIVDADVVDEDTGTAVGKKYILSAPADKPEFISPLTTLVQQQMEKNPALSSEQAEKVVMTQAGAGEGVSVFSDYVAEKTGNSNYQNLHMVARVVAAAFGEVQEKVEAAAENAGQTPEEILDALVQIVVDRIMERLTDIAVAVEDTTPENFNPGTIANAIEAQAEMEEPIAETIADKIEEAETPAVVSSFKSLLESGGVYWLMYDSYWKDLQYEIITLASDKLAEESYEYDFEAGEWIEDYDSGTYLLTPSGWSWSSDSPEEGTITFNSDGTAIWTSALDGAKSKIYAAEVDLVGKKMGPFAGPTASLLAHPDAVFPPGAKVWKLTFVELTDSYEVKISGKNSEEDIDHNIVSYRDSTGEHPIASLAEMRTHYAKGSDNFHYFEHWQLQFDENSNVYVYDGSTLKETGTWSETTINNQKAMMLHLSELVRLRGDIEGIPFFIEWEGGLVKRGEYYPAGNVRVDDYEFNKTAFEALKDNLELRKDDGDEPAPMPGPRNLAAFFYGSTDDGLNVFAEAVTGASDYVLYASTDGINFQEVDLNPTHSSASCVIFDHLASQDVWLKMTALVNGAETEYSNTIFVEHDGRTTIDDIITLNTPSTEGQVLSLDSPFKWSPVSGAQSYFVLIEANEAEDSALAKVAGTSWQYGDTSNLIAGYFLPPLVEGASYGIAVGAVDANGTIIGTSPNIDFIVRGGGFTQSFLEGKTFMEMETGADFQMLVTFLADGAFVERGENFEGEWVESGEWSINPDGTLRMYNVSGHTDGFERTITLTGDFPERFEMDYQQTDGEVGSKIFIKADSFSFSSLAEKTFINQTDGTSVTYNADGSGYYVRDDAVRVDFTWSIQADGSVVMARAGGRFDRVYRLYGGSADQFEIGGYEANESGQLEGVYRDTMTVGEALTGEAYSTADLAGTWYARGLYTQKDGQPDHFGYDIGTFVFDAVGNFTGTMWDENGESWTETDTASLNQDGSVNLWENEQGLIMPAAMNAAKDVMINNYQDDDEYSVGVWVKRGNSYVTSDLAGIWHVAGLSTHKNGQPDNFGAGFSTFTFDADGSFTGSTDTTGDTWEDSDTASVNADGTVNLWESELGLILPTAMNASKDVMISNFQGIEEYAFDVWVKAGTNYQTSDLAGTWHFRGLCTQKNGQPDNFGYDIGVYRFNADGSFTGTMWAADGESWNETNTATVNQDGTIKVWGSTGNERQTAMNAGKNVMVSRYEGDDDFCMDVWVKAAE